MVYLKSCPKCLGDLTLGRDSYGTFISCLQCGFMRDVDAAPVAMGASTTAAVRERWYQNEQLAKAA